MREEGPSAETAVPAPPSLHETRRTIRTFAIASFLNDLGSDIIYPIWPLFVTQVLKANMAALGFLDGLGEAVVSLSQAVSGHWSDKLRRRKVFVWIGYLCGAASRLGYAASSIWPHLVPFRVLDRAGKIRSAPRDAIVADVSTDANRGRHFGLLRAMDNLGAVAGILVAIALFDVLGYRLLFALAAIPSVIGALFILKSIKEPREPGGRVFKGFSLRDVDRDLGPALRNPDAVHAEDDAAVGAGRADETERPTCRDRPVDQRIDSVPQVGRRDSQIGGLDQLWIDVDFRAGQIQAGNRPGLRFRDHGLRSHQLAHHLPA